MPSVPAFFLFLLLSCLAVAIPISLDSVDDSVKKASVLLCTDTNYTGLCTSHPTSQLGNDACNTLNNTNTIIKSIKPSNGLDCIFYTNGICRTFLDPSTESLSVRYPGNADLTAVTGWSLKKPLLSYACVSVNKTTDYDVERR